MYQQAILDNKIHVLTEDIPHVRSIVIGIWVNVGSRDEPGEITGVSHFLEHLMFKGTSKRSARDIAVALDAVGGHLNAFTTKEYTCYYIRVIDEYFDLALDILADMVLESRLATDDLNRERNVIAEEIKMYEDTPDELVHDLFATTIWQNHALGRSILGNAEVIENMKRDEIISYYKAHYVPANMVISVAGNINNKKVLEKIRNVFGQFEGEAKSNRRIIPVPHRLVACRKKDTEQVHLCLGVPGLPLHHDLVYVMQLISTSLGGGLSSRLFQEIRESRGLVYSVYSYHSSYQDTGLFCIYAGLSSNNLSQVMELILKEIRDIQENGIKDEELRRAKDQLKGNLFLSLENVTTRMSRLAKSILYLGEVITPEEVLEKVNQVTREQTRDVARAMLSPQSFAIASVGPWDDCRSLEESVDSVFVKTS